MFLTDDIRAVKSKQEELFNDKTSGCLLEGIYCVDYCFYILLNLIIPRICTAIGPMIFLFCINQASKTIIINSHALQVNKSG